MHVDHAVQDLRRIKAQKVATELESAADIASADWNAMTGEHFTTDAVSAIAAAAEVIEQNGGVADTIASDPKPFRIFERNSKAPVNGPPDARFGNRVANNIVGLPGFTWYMDTLKTDTLVTVYDKSAILLLQGPVRTAQYRKEGQGIEVFGSCY